MAASPAAHSASGGSVSTDNVKARLISETNAIAPGQSIWVALELDIREGWHTYWRNPGDSGQATQLSWTLPAGLTAGGIVWPAPHRFEIAPLVNYGYAKHAMHLVKLTASPDLKTGAPVDLAAKASWLVCADVCIPESANLHLRLPVQAGDGSRGLGGRAAVRGGARRSAEDRAGGERGEDRRRPARAHARPGLGCDAVPGEIAGVLSLR